MKYFILALIVLKVCSFSLGDDWNGMEDVIKVQQDAILEIVDQLDLDSQIPITQQIDNQVQQLINQPNELQQQDTSIRPDEEVHSLEYWLERLGDEYSDETILIQQPQSISEQITSVVGNLVLKVGDQNILKQQVQDEEPLIISGIELEMQKNENIQMKQLIDSALDMQQKVFLNTDDQIQNKKHKKKRPIITIDFNDISESENNTQNENYDIAVSEDTNDKDQNIENDNTNLVETDEQVNNDQNQEIDNSQENQVENQEINQLKFEPNEDTILEVVDNKQMFNFLTGKKEVENETQDLNKVIETSKIRSKEYSFNTNTMDQRSFYRDSDESAVAVVEREKPIEQNFNRISDQEKPKSVETKPENKEPETTITESPLKKYLLYTDQPQVIPTGNSEKEIEEDKKLIQAFKSTELEGNWVRKQNNQKINTDYRGVDFKTPEREDIPEFKEVEESKIKKIFQKEEVKTNDSNEKEEIENPHKFISFKPNPDIDLPQKPEVKQSRYEQLPETKLLSKEEMKREKQQKIQEMQRQIEEQLKTKKLSKKSETDKSLSYESEYLTWERATQGRSYNTDINFVMTSNNLRKRQ